MSHWLYCWELGAGLGHLLRMRTVSTALASQGVELTWCVPGSHLATAHTLWPGVIESPDCRPPNPSVREPGGFAEILQNEGWHDSNCLAAWIAEWREIYSGVEPDRILLDFAPNAFIAALAAGFRPDVIGSGFYVPPNEFPLPTLRHDLGVYPDRLTWAEDRIAETASQWIPEAGDGLCGLFHHRNVGNHLMTCPELDHYPVRKGQRHLGIATDYTGGGLVLEPGADPRLFAYLKPFPGLAAFMQTVSDLGLEGLVHGNHAVKQVLESLALPRLTFHPDPVDERHLAAAKLVLIHHAGHDGTAKSALAGLPMLQLPLNLEQLITATNASTMGVANWVAASRTDLYRAALEDAIDGHAQRAEVARTWGSRQPLVQENLQRLVDELLTPLEDRT